MVDSSPIPKLSIVKAQGTADNRSLRGQQALRRQVKETGMDQTTLSTILLILAGAVLSAYLLHRRKRKAQ